MTTLNRSPTPLIRHRSVPPLLHLQAQCPQPSPPQAECQHWKALPGPSGALDVWQEHEDTYRSRWCRPPTAPLCRCRGGTGLRGENRVRSRVCGTQTLLTPTRSRKSSDLREQDRGPNLGHHTGGGG